MDYQSRKEARRAEFLAKHGKPQPRRVMRVYAQQILRVLPDRFLTMPVGVFSSRHEAEEFTRDVGPGTNYGSKAMKALGSMMTREERNQCAPGFESYVRFSIASEEIA